jgi:hypothetical protein
MAGRELSGSLPASYSFNKEVCMNAKLEKFLLISSLNVTALILGTAQVGLAQDSNGGPMLRGRITNAPSAQSNGHMTLVPSVAGPAIIGPNGELLGTLSMQNGLPAGTIVIPSAIGPLAVGPRGEFRGTLESYSKGKERPLFGMGPWPNYSALNGLNAMRNMFVPGSSFPLMQPAALVQGPASNSTITVPIASPRMRSSEYARVFPARNTSSDPVSRYKRR